MPTIVKMLYIKAYSKFLPAVDYFFHITNGIK